MAACVRVVREPRLLAPAGELGAGLRAALAAPVRAAAGPPVVTEPKEAEGPDPASARVVAAAAAAVDEERRIARVAL